MKCIISKIVAKTLKIGNSNDFYLNKSNAQNFKDFPFAKEMILECQKQNQIFQFLENQSNLINFLPSFLSGGVFCINTQFSVDWNNENIDLIVKSIENHLDQNIKIEQNTNSNLNLNLNFQQQKNEFESFRINSNTKIRIINKKNIEINQVNESRISDSFAGYKKTITEIITLLFSQINSPRKGSNFLGILLYGLSGTGKTTLINLIMKNSHLQYFSINPSSLFQKNRGESERKLQDIFIQAKKNAPSFILIDDIDGFVCYDKKTVDVSIEMNLFYLLLEMIDKLSSKYDNYRNNKQVIVIGTTTNLQLVHPLLRRNQDQNQFENQNQFLSQKTHGFVASDLIDLVNQIVLSSLKKSQNINQISNQPFFLDFEDLNDILFKMKPANLRESNIFSSSKMISFEDLVGMDEIIKILKASVILPLNEPNKFQSLGITPPKGILISGEPGSGKTKLVEALANESGLNLIFIESTSILSKVVGQSEQAIKKIFQKSRSSSPCILFFDQIEAISQIRKGGNSSTHAADRVLTCLLTEMDGIETNETNDPNDSLIIIGATNSPQFIDPALLRPGRFDLHLKIPSLDFPSRLKLLNSRTKKMPLDLEAKEYLKIIAKETDGYCGADIEMGCQETALFAMNENINVSLITKNHLQNGFNQIKKFNQFPKNNFKKI
ncbi:aaa-family atpase [Anaeramoeba ignava]|uniref:Aaa-family atpase n=1 Tax=Anaeramoeba ignava TaxID=1746090 RepID=A0A9Q0LIT8_ANAIG|nr:aaa-family atpase [Anaeramoeba ignava]